MFSQSKVRIILPLIMALALVGQAWAGGEKERMHQRLPAIKALKANGVVGENNKGLLTLRKNSDQKGLVDAENRDRMTVYRLIAKQQGTTPDRVGQRRAMQIAKKAAPGTWVQGPGGNWKQR